MMTRRFIPALLALLLSLGAPTLVYGQDALSAAKTAGQIGERPDGLVGALPDAPAAARALASDINAQRLARYQEIARGNGTALDKVQAVAGEQLVERTPAGQFVMTPAGQWRRK